MNAYTLEKKELALNKEYEIIVVGGGPAGCAAAIAAARQGCKTLLLEASFALGGMGTQGLVPWFCGYHDGEKIIARGIAEKILLACRDNVPHFKKAMSENPLSSPGIDQEFLKRIYDDMLVEAGVDILFGTQLCGVEMADSNKIDAILASNKSGVSAFRASVYVDCTGDGDMAAWAGADFEKGDENGSLQPATHCFAITNIDEYAFENGAHIHFFDPDSPIHKAVHSSKYPLIEELHSCLRQIGPKTFGFNTGHLFDVDNTDPENLSKALIHGRKMAAQYRDAFAEFHPAFKNSFLCCTGSLMGIRETRRITGDYVLTADDYLERRSFSDEICRNAYGIDVHFSKEIALSFPHKSIEEVKGIISKRTKHYEKGESFGVPYRCLTPKGMDNILVAGRCISSDRQANGSIRIMACCLNTGEAAGIAAAMACRETCNVHDVDTNELRERLLDNGAYLPKQKD
jgi:hypothetical protein